MLSVYVYRAPLRDCRGSNGHILAVRAARPSNINKIVWKILG
jgi:hypothetical protein